MNFCVEFLQELSIVWEAISNTRKSVSSYFQTPRSWLKKTRLRLIFPTYFSVFGNRRKHFSSCLIYYLKSYWKRVESNLNLFKLTFNIDSSFPLLSKMLNGVETLSSTFVQQLPNICSTRLTFVERMLRKCWNRLLVNGLLKTCSQNKNEYSQVTANGGVFKTFYFNNNQIDKNKKFFQFLPPIFMKSQQVFAQFDLKTENVH